MEQVALGDSNLSISTLCLGTMTFGEQNSEAEAHAQLDLATANGINFIDTAEMYPVMARAETCGATETIIGNWLARNPQKRSTLVIATKIAGPSRGFNWIRNGQLDFDRANINAAIDASLKRLRTDHVDLYQLHWPNRNIPLFGQTRFNPQREFPFTPIAEQLEALADLVKAGKVRHIGVSNESCWGISEFVRESNRLSLPKIVSVQNAFNLMNRSFEQGLDEVCFRENIGLLAYSPLAFGRLTGKYAADARAKGRLTEFPPNWSPRYMRPQVLEAERRYAELARRFGLTPAKMAIAWVRSRWYVASTIIGATSLEQLQENIDAANLTLDEALLIEIDALHQQLMNPAQ